MLWNSVWRSWRNKIGENKRVNRRRPALSRACLAEVLEDRCLLSTITVTTLSDNLTVDGQVTLREAIQAANSNAAVDGSTAGQSGTQDQIVFQSGLVGTVHLNPALGQLVINESVKITGLGAKDTLIDAGQNSRVFSVTNVAGDVGFDAVTISGGKTTASADVGAGIRFLSAGTLTITNSALAGNTTTGFNASGAAIFTNTGAVKLQNSLLSGNSTTGQFGQGIAIFSQNAPLTLVNSTVSGNTASGLQGGACIYAVGSLASLTMTNTTVTANFGLGEDQVATGGIAVGNGAVTLKNCIISGNLGANGSEFDIGIGENADPATFTASHTLIGVNVSSDFVPLPPAPIGHPDANGNLIGTIANPIDAKLLPLADNGGPTMTHAILAGSPVIDAGLNSIALGLDGSPLTTDQRGTGFPRIDHGIVDMGSFEGHNPNYPPLVPNTPLVVTTAEDELDVDLSDPGDLSLREAIEIANSTFGPDTITFDPVLKDVPLLLTLGQLTLDDDLTIIGFGQEHTVIDADGNSRVIDLHRAGTDLTLEGVTVTGGKTFNDNEKGAGIRMPWGGALAIRNSSISGNSTEGDGAFGAGIFAGGGSVVIENSLISGNSTTGEDSDGGAIFSYSSAISLTSSTVSGNTTAGIDADGAGIYTFYAEGSVTLTNTTVTNNSAIGNQAGGTGGISVIRGAVTIRNSIVSGNFQRDGSERDLFVSTYAAPMPFQLKNSLIGFGIKGITPLTPAPVGSPDANGNLIGTLAHPIDAMLFPLSANGGTKMHLLAPGSPAINAGNNALALDPNGQPLAYDQRGAQYARILWGTVDMGAFEAYMITPATPFPRLDSIEGFYYANGHVAQILRAGDTLTFIDGNGGTSTGHVIDATHVVATDWDLDATFYPDLGGLIFEDGTIWGSVRQLQGIWLNPSGAEVGVRQLGTDLIFTNVLGQSTNGTYLEGGTLSNPGWGVTGTLSWDAQTINWSNGTVWKFLPNLQGNWVNAGGAATRIEQQGKQLLFINRVGQTSLGTFTDAVTVKMGDNWGGQVGTLRDGTIDWATGLDWSRPTLTAGYPDLGGLWQPSTVVADVRILQANQTLTFVNRLGQTSAGHFISPTQVSADDWGSIGNITDGKISWVGSNDWLLVPHLAGSYLNPANQQAGLRQLERSLTFINGAGTVSHGTLVGLTQIVETDYLQRTVTIAGNVLTWSNGPTWSKVAALRGDWSLATNNAPTYIEQSGLSLLLVGATGTIYRGSVVSPTQAQVSAVGAPNPPIINLGITNDHQLVFDGVTWNKSLVNNLDAFFSSPNDWPFV